MVKVHKVERSIQDLEVAVRGIVLRPKPEPRRLLDITMRVLAEEDRLESMLEKAETKERKEIDEALKRLKDIKRSLLRVYFSSLLLGTFKFEYVPAIASLGRRGRWSP